MLKRNNSDSALETASGRPARRAQLILTETSDGQRAEEKRIYNRQWYQDHKEHAKLAARQYRLSNPEKASESQLHWREKNKERLAAYNKDYQERNKERVAQTAREKRLLFFAESPKTAWLYYTFQAARGRAKKTDLPYDQDPSGLVLPDVCPVLGISLKYSERRGAPAADSPSLDRVIPQRGYVISNLRVISWRANVLKRDASIDEIRRVLAYVEECLTLEETC